MPTGHAPTDQPSPVIHDALAGSTAPAPLLDWQTAPETLVGAEDGHAA